MDEIGLWQALAALVVAGLGVMLHGRWARRRTERKQREEAAKRESVEEALHSLAEREEESRIERAGARRMAEEIARLKAQREAEQAQRDADLAQAQAPAAAGEDGPAPAPTATEARDTELREAARREAEAHAEAQRAAQAEARARAEQALREAQEAAHRAEQDNLRNEFERLMAAQRGEASPAVQAESDSLPPLEWAITGSPAKSLDAGATPDEPDTLAEPVEPGLMATGEDLEAEALKAERVEAERLEAERLEEQRLEEQRLLAEREAAAREVTAREAAAREAQARETEAREAAAREAAQRHALIEAARLEAERRQAADRARVEAQRRAAPPAAEAPASTVDTPIVVMVVDDSKVVRVKTSRVLARAQYQVLLADDGTDAVKQLESTLPHVLITDVEMPGMDGFTLTRHVRGHARTSHIPVIMITSSDDKHRAEAQAAGVSVLLGKPYEEDDLLARIQALLPAAVAA